MTSYLAQDRLTGLAVLDVRDQGKAVDYFLFRTGSRQLQDWADVGHTLLPKDFFYESLASLGFDQVSILDLDLSDYGNSPYAYNVFAVRA